MRQVTVQFFKNPDRIHWGFEARYLGRDEWGDWMAVPTGSKRWKGEQAATATRKNAVFCAPRDGWWHLHYGGPAAETYSAFVDIVTPPVWVSANRYEMIDLDLDVTLGVDGTIVIEDEDEFEVHQIEYGYTPEMVRRASEEANRVFEALQERQEPFFEVAQEWLRRVRAPGGRGGG